MEKIINNSISGNDRMRGFISLHITVIGILLLFDLYLEKPRRLHRRCLGKHMF